MTEQEIKVEKLDERVTSLERQVSNTMTKVDMLVSEMRDRDNQRAEDIREIRTSIGNMQNRIEDMGKHVRNLAITSMAAVGGMFVAVGAMVATVIYSILKS